MRQKTRFFIYILVAIAVVIMGTLAMLNARQADKPASAQEHIDLGRIYLIDLSYERAVLEFTEAIEIEPLNADAYLGLAEAYVGMGDIVKAISVLEKGYEITEDPRIKTMLENLLNSKAEETAVTTVFKTAAATEPTTVTTIETDTTSHALEMVTVPDLSGLTEKAAASECEAALLGWEIKKSKSDEVEKFYVISQSVPAGASVPVNYVITIYISDGMTITGEEAVTEISEAATSESEQISLKYYATDFLGMTMDEIAQIYAYKYELKQGQYMNYAMYIPEIKYMFFPEDAVYSESDFSMEAKVGLAEIYDGGEIFEGILVGGKFSNAVEKKPELFLWNNIFIENVNQQYAYQLKYGDIRIWMVMNCAPKNLYRDLNGDFYTTDDIGLYKDTISINRVSIEYQKQDWWED